MMKNIARVIKTCKFIFVALDIVDIENLIVVLYFLFTCNFEEMLEFFSLQFVLCLNYSIFSFGFFSNCLDLFVRIL
jgi:hypothetical protein